MEKIRALMQKCGLSPEAADSICEALQEARDTDAKQLAEYKSRCDVETAAKLAEAKKLCVEEVESHKRELARRVQIFCEAKAAAIESSVAKHAAIKESTSSAKLREVKSLLEGVQANAVRKDVTSSAEKSLRARIRQLTEGKAKAEEAANRAIATANKVLSRNRLLESKVQEVKTLQESAKPKQLDTNRRSVRPVTSRPTLVENQNRRPTQTPASKPEGFSPEGIANLISEDLV